MSFSVPAIQHNLQLADLLAKPQPTTTDSTSLEMRFEDILSDEIRSLEASDIESTNPATAEPFRKFEAFILQTFFQELLPENTESVFGKGFAGDVWKSMMAEKLADVVAKSGGIGIADLLEQKTDALVPSD